MGPGVDGKAGVNRYELVGTEVAVEVELQLG